MMFKELKSGTWFLKSNEEELDKWMTEKGIRDGKISASELPELSKRLEKPVCLMKLQHPFGLEQYNAVNLINGKLLKTEEDQLVMLEPRPTASVFAQ